MMNMTETVKQLIIINVLFFVGTMALGDFNPSNPAYRILALYYPENNNFEFWQPVTHMFMHGGFMHIAFNMFALYSFGSALEHFWGGKKFLFFYISCGLGSALLHTGINYIQIHSLLDSVSNLNLSKADLNVILNADYKSLFDSNGNMIAGNVKTILENAKCNQEQFNVLVEAASVSRGTVVGASGAIYGLLTAFAFIMPNAELALMFIPVPIKAKYFVPGLLAIDLFLGFKGSSLFGSGGTGIAHFAHVGGALTGFLIMWYWKKNQFNNNRWN
ncbi:rhomboid family intramembrane serine protease [Flavobacterium sp. GA093]|uniref:Rhomboid family intramembrane serine protease n=1 Tax=Flavobacterium hydrocarbonoxydans TaxID=2683249 RepID=A0A6I4NU26_9FLAO|nr:rhomboid family intramembrane serine protease [Flavobacterium hydrocarbonoxydans]MWB94607.1 rhomboid family intramembrane serine protease [Flavobacterium hydrocarbonoxydans]